MLRAVFRLALRQTEGLNIVGQAEEAALMIKSLAALGERGVGLEVGYATPASLHVPMSLPEVW